MTDDSDDNCCIGVNSVVITVSAQNMLKMKQSVSVQMNHLQVMEHAEYLE